MKSETSLLVGGIKDTAAFDITVTSPQGPTIVSEVGVDASVTAKAAQNHKNLNTLTQSA